MPDESYVIQNHNLSQLENLAAFFERYQRTYPDAKLLSAGFYTYHPAAENGQNVFLALDQAGQVRGFAPLFPAPVAEDCPPADPHHIWTILLADPGMEGDLPMRRLLLERLLQRANGIAAGFPASRPTRLASDIMVSQKADIAFLMQNGFEHYDGMYVMQYPAGKPVPEVALPPGLAIRCWKLGSRAEQEQYLQAYNICFPDNPKTLETLRFLLDSPLWADGMALSVFRTAGDLIASILVYPSGQGFGVTDDVFVLPAWRGQSIARFLIGEGVKYFLERGTSDMRLEVKQSNRPAVGVYSSMGYEVINEEVFVGLFL